MNRSSVLLTQEMRGFILKFMKDTYPHGITLKLIEALLPPWGYFVTQVEIRAAAVYLINHGLAETRMPLPADMNSVTQLFLTAKGHGVFSSQAVGDLEIILPREHAQV